MPEKYTNLNPYRNSPETIRFVSNVDKSIYNFFYAIFPTNGLQQTTINIIFARLHAKCIELGITPGSERSDQRFLELITGFRFELTRGTSESIDESTKRLNDTGTTKSSSSTSKTTKDNVPIIPSTIGKRKQRVVTKRTEGK